MIRRTAKIAASIPESDYVVATDHVDILNHCETYDIPAVMTDSNLESGSDRTLAAATTSGKDVDMILNLQGDAPFTDPSHVEAVLNALKSTKADLATPAIQLDWESLDSLRQAKISTPFSGTTVTEINGRALWFSKNIIPALRKENEMRQNSVLSPVLRHVGLYGFRRSALERFTALPQSYYEKIEGLEQLRALEDGMHIEIVKVAPAQVSSPGIDTLEDLSRAEELIRLYGDPFFL